MDKKQINDLLIKIQSGDENSFENFYCATNKGVFSFVYMIVKNKEDAEDITQETFIKVKQNVMGYRPNTNAVAWIFQIAKNLAYDFLRRRKKEADIDTSEIVVPDSRDKISEKEDNMMLHRLMLENLDEVSRQIVDLHIIAGFKHREIAKQLGLPLGTVLWKYNRAMKTLQDKLK